jgi:hypothetical protein
VRASVRRRCRASVSWNLNDLDICAETNNESHQQGHHFATRKKKQKTNETNNESHQQRHRFAIRTPCAHQEGV